MGGALRFLRVEGSFFEFFTSMTADGVFLGVTDFNIFALPVFTGVFAKFMRLTTVLGDFDDGLPP